MKTLLMVFLTIGLCLALNFAGAQTGSSKIEGRITDATNKPADGATVSLVKAQNLAMVKTFLANTDGSFAFADVPKGVYRVVVTAVGYQNYKSDSLIIDKQQNLNLPAIVLVATSKELKQVEITAQKAFVEQKIDRTVVNVNSLISNTGSNALEALEKMPGVLVDQDGNISFKGKTGVMILIDDKPTYLSGENLANYLKSIPASQLDVVELMSNPPAKYDASGNAGVINIKTKKSTTKGFNGTFTASVGDAHYWRTLESLSLNYHVNKVNLFANMGYGVQNSYRRLDVTRQYLDASGNLTSGYLETAFFNPTSYNRNIKAGMDYYVSPKTTIGFVLTGLLTTGHNPNYVYSSITDPAGKIDSNVIATDNTQSRFYNEGINLNYNHDFDKKGQSLSFDLDYLKYGSSKDQSFVNATYNTANIFESGQNIIDNLPVDINIYTAKADYVQPLAGKAKIETGIKTSYVNTDNAANYFNVVNGISTVDNENSNRFLYKENINAGYVNFSDEFKRLSVQAGLRVENTNVNGHQLGNAVSPDSSSAQHYTDLFPTAYLLYKLDTAGSHTLKATYGRRIDRPYYQDLNPFVFILDKYSGGEGNPFLRPQFISEYEFTYAYKSIFSFGFDYNRTTDYQVEYDFQKGDVFLSTVMNLGLRVQWALESNLSFNPAKWWTFNLYGELDHTTYRGQLNTSYLNNTNVLFYFNNTNQFSLSNGWSAELSSFYISPSQDAQFTHRYREQTNIGIQKRIWKDKASIKLSARDVFRANFSAGSITNIPNVIATYHNDNANRSATLAFTYNFGSTKNEAKKRETNGAEDEQKRVGN